MREPDVSLGALKPEGAVYCQTAVNCNGEKGLEAATAYAYCGRRSLYEYLALTGGKRKRGTEGDERPSKSASL